MKFSAKAALASLCLCSTAVIYTQCGKNAHLYMGSKAERAVIQSKVFSFQNFSASTSIVNDGDDLYNLLWDGTDQSFDLGDSFIPLNHSKDDGTNFQWVSRCNQLESVGDAAKKTTYLQAFTGLDDVAAYQNIESSYELEKAYVLDLVKQRYAAIEAGEDLPLLIPVQYSISTGDKHDKISHMAYKRSILRSDHDGVSYIQPRGPKTHIVDSSGAKQDFVSGKMQYFSVVPVTETKINARPMNNYVPFAQQGGFGIWNAYNMHKTKSGLETINDYKDHLASLADTGEPLIANLYLADIRDEILPFDSLGLMNEDISSVGRNNEVLGKLKDIFNLKTIFKNRQLITAGLSATRTVTNKNYTQTYLPYDGAAQVVQRMNCDVGTSRVISARYTPIVLDLGRPFIRTTSEYWGSFFNLAGASIKQDGQILENKDAASTYTHRVAWVGGYVEKIPNPLFGQENVTTSQEYIWQRVADDGILILAPENPYTTEITGEHLFGSEFKNPNDTTKEYENGFEALQDYAGTEMACATPPESSIYHDEPSEEQIAQRHQDIKDRYIGPWSDAYTKLQIWTDKNLNGVVDMGELATLADKGVLAINTCLTSINTISEFDQYGNNTTLRSAFLYNSNLEDLTEEQILYRLTYGKTEADQSANFRAMIDIYFKARPYHFLERSLKYRNAKDGKDYKVDIGGEEYVETDDSLEVVDVN